MGLRFVNDMCVDVANDGVHYLPPTATRTRRTKKKRIANDACIVVLLGGCTDNTNGLG